MNQAQFTVVKKTPSTIAPLDSKLLIGPQGYVDILHAGNVYRLRITKYGKLLLTK